MNANDSTELLREGRRVLATEAKALDALGQRLGDEFVRAVEVLAGAGGRIIVSGIGKSGIVGRKIAATLTSTGSPATFLHPVEGLHGDMGIVGRDDVAILISKSGDTAELTGLIEYLVRFGVPIVALVGASGSSLARASQVALDCSVDEEACPLDLAPTTSTTAALAMGDALAVVLFQKKGFKAEDFAQFHPGGSLGRKLTLRVEEVMVADDYPWRGAEDLLKDCIVPLAEMRGTVPIIDEDRRVVGVVTAGDLTRLMEGGGDFLQVPVREVMTHTPKLCHEGDLASAAVHRMEKHGIMALPVVNEEECLIGVVHLHDLMKAGVV
jgi:arabinose-5-phosphate isomerase